jgi:rubrerythrin
MKQLLEVSRRYLVLPLIDLLNQDLSREYQAIIGYVVYSQVLKGAEFMNIAGELEKHAAQELSHALTIAKQIDYLGGMPAVEAKTVRTSEKAAEMLQFDLENETETIRNYRVYRDTKKVWPVFAPATMHQCCLPGSYHPSERASPTTCAGVGQHARVRQSTAAKKEGGSLVRGTEESNRIATLAPAETQVRARAVLPGSGSSEHQATGALPQSADSTGSAGHHLVEPKQESRRRRARR